MKTSLNRFSMIRTLLIFGACASASFGVEKPIPPVEETAMGPQQTILFLDNWMIESQVGLERMWGKPRFVKEVFEDIHPGALGYGGYASMFWDEKVGKYVMYAAVYPPEADPGTFVLRLESDDAYTWADPKYEVAVSPAWKGFDRVVVDETGNRFWAIYINSLAGTPFSDRGYLMTTYHPDRQVNQSIAGVSEEGIVFDLSQTRPWQSTRADTWCGWIWNPYTEKFQINTRPTHVDRRISMVTSSDLKTFSPARTVLQPDAIDPPGTEFYSMPVKFYEGMFIGLLHVFSTDPFEEGRIKMAGRNQTQLAYSYNGLNWYRGEREPFVANRELGEMGGGQVFAMEMLRTHENKLLFLTSASIGEHAAYTDMQNAGMNTRGVMRPLLYEMRLDGFAAMRTRSKDGVLRTKTIIPQSGELSINVKTPSHTAVQVQILDGETGQPIPGYTREDSVAISGDHLFARPTWKGKRDLSELVGKPIRIEVYMREAELFAIRIPCHIYIGTAPKERI